MVPIELLIFAVVCLAGTSDGKPQKMEGKTVDSMYTIMTNAVDYI